MQCSVTSIQREMQKSESNNTLDRQKEMMYKGDPDEPRTPTKTRIENTKIPPFVESGRS